jgi:hypothetical protein
VPGNERLNKKQRDEANRREMFESGEQQQKINVVCMIQRRRRCQQSKLRH